MRRLYADRLVLFTAVIVVGLAAVFAWLRINEDQALAAQTTAGDVSNGQRLAEQHCATCHRVGPAPGHGSGQVTPLFRIAARSDTTAESLRAILARPHGRIPPNTFSAEQVDDLVTYILSLKP